MSGGPGGGRLRRSVAPVARAAAGAAAALTWTWLLARGFGRPESPWAPWSLAPWHVALAGLTAGSVTFALKPGPRAAIPAALVVGAIALPVFAARNAASDTRALETARATALASGEPAALEAYVAAGGRRAREVEATLLPRVELSRLVRVGSAEELDRFAAAHPPLAGEASAARPEVLHREFAAAADVAGLRVFLARHPEAADAPAARAKLAQAIDEARGRLREGGAREGRDPDAPQVLDALLAWSSAREGAPIEVRFRRRTAASLASADALLGRGLLEDGPAPGGSAPASPHFDDAHEAPRQRAVLHALEQALGADLPPEVLRLSLGAPLSPVASRPSPDQVPGLTRPLPTGDVAEAAQAAPRVLVDYEVAWSGRTYVGRERGRRFVGVAYQFFVVVTAPGLRATLDLQTRVEPEATFPVDYAGEDAGGSPDAGAASDERVYEVMALRAFDQMASRLRARAHGL